MRSRLHAIGLILFVLAVAATPAAAAGSPPPASPLPPLTVSPAHVLPGGSFFVAGSGCFPPPGTEAFFEVEAEGPGGGFGGGGTGVPGGHWRIGFEVPAHTPPGVLRITAQCDLATGKIQYPRSTVTVEPTRDPSVTLSRNRVQAGGSLTIKAAGFFLREHLTIALRGVGLLAVVTTDDTGTATAAVHLPGGAPAGPAHIDVTGTSSARTAAARLTVLAAPGQCGATSCEPTPPPLADTGVSAGTQTLVGAGLLALGALFLAAGRRRAPAGGGYFM